MVNIDKIKTLFSGKRYDKNISSPKGLDEALFPKNIPEKLLDGS